MTAPVYPPMDPQVLVKSLAALFFYENKALDDERSFEELELEDQREFLDDARGVIEKLEKLNLMPVPFATVQENDEARRNAVSLMEGRIRGFIGGLQVLSKDGFPAHELAVELGQDLKL